MANYILEIIEDQNNYYVTPEEINYFIEVINTEKILVSDLPDNIPVSKIFDLDEYLDQYEFDCGTPLPP